MKHIKRFNESIEWDFQKTSKNVDLAIEDILVEIQDEYGHAIDTKVSKVNKSLRMVDFFYNEDFLSSLNMERDETVNDHRAVYMKMDLSKENETYLSNLTKEICEFIPESFRKYSKKFDFKYKNYWTHSSYYSSDRCLIEVTIIEKTED